MTLDPPIPKAIGGVRGQKYKNTSWSYLKVLFYHEFNVFYGIRKFDSSQVMAWQISRIGAILGQKMPFFGHLGA